MAPEFYDLCDRMADWIADHDQDDTGDELLVEYYDHLAAARRDPLAHLLGSPVDIR